jgi:thioredoxin reductase
MVLRVRPQIFDILIIGSGPAGLNAALTCARTRSKAIVFDNQQYRNEGVTHMHTVASRDHFNPREFGRIAREQVESRYDTIWFQAATITHAKKKQVSVPDEKGLYDGFEVTDSDGHSYEGKKIILATGSRDVFPEIQGYKENWPAHVYQCLACDGYEQRGSAVGILGFDSPMYTHFVQMAIPLEPTSITIFSNGPIKQEEPVQEAMKLAKAFGATLDERKIVRLVNNGPSHTDGVTIHFETGEPVTLGFIVHKPATVNRAQHLIEQLGVDTVEPAMGGHIKIANAMFNETSVTGVFAAGDTMLMMKQVAIAMAEGLKAAAGAGMQIAQEKAKSLSKTFEEREGTVEGEKDKAEVASY